VIGVAISSDDDFRTRATLSYIEDTNLLNRFARTYTASAQDAQTHVVLNHDIAGSFVSVAERELLYGGYRDVVSNHVFLEGVPGIGPATVGQVVSRIALQQEVENAAAVCH
jgi:adenylate kinase